MGWRPSASGSRPARGARERGALVPRRGIAFTMGFALIGAWLSACGDPVARSLAGAPALEGSEEAARAGTSDPFEAERHEMVSDQIEARGVRDARVLAAMRKVPRHEFVPEALRRAAYRDQPLPIGHGQTISQPYIVAVTTELAALDAGSRVLEVGTGSGYQAAVLAEVAKEVYTIEILEPLAAQAARTLRRLRYGSVHTRTGDGYRGWPEAAPFDAIVVTAAAPVVPPALLEQLAVGGRLVIPVGDWDQHLEVHSRTERGVDVRRVLPVRFVPMTGEVEKTGR